MVKRTRRAFFIRLFCELFAKANLEKAPSTFRSGRSDKSLRAGVTSFSSTLFHLCFCHARLWVPGKVPSIR